MKEFIEKNKRLLQSYHVVARFIGWLILFMGFSGILILLIMQSQIGFGQSVTIMGALGVFLRSWFVLIATGFILLGSSQFIRYMLDDNYHPGWILLYGDKILYIFSFLIVWHTVTMVIFYFSKADITDAGVWLLNILPMLLLNLAKVLVLVGISQIIKRVLPVIEEYKSLV